MGRAQALTDNGLIRAITKPGHYDRYIRYCTALEAMGVDLNNCEFIVTHSSLLEVIGITLPALPQLRADPKLLNNTISAYKEKSKESAETSDLLRFDIMKKYELYLSEVPELKTEYIKLKLEEQLKYVDSNLKNWFYETFSRPFKSKDQHGFICNRIAVDRMYGYDYPDEIKPLMDSTTIVDIIKGAQVGHNLPQGRGLAKLWKSFGESSKQMVIENFNDPKYKSFLTLEETLNNIDTATECFDFKNRRDFLDLDLIHFATVGRISESDKLEKVYCLTADPRKKAKVRIQMMKSFVLQTKEMFGAYLDGFEEKEGHVGFFHLDGNLIESIDVKNEPRLFERIHIEKIIL